MERAVPRYELPEGELDPDLAYDLIHDELMLDGNARLNLATLVTTWMEPQAEKLMAECFDKNMIDKDEYPYTTMAEPLSTRLPHWARRSDHAGGLRCTTCSHFRQEQLEERRQGGLSSRSSMAAPREGRANQQLVCLGANYRARCSSKWGTICSGASSCRKWPALSSQRIGASGKSFFHSRS
jgi:hypothetical protein